MREPNPVNVTEITYGNYLTEITEQADVAIRPAAKRIA